MPKFKFRGDATLSCGVSNLEKSLKWYEDTLGCKTVFQVPEIGWAEVQTPVEGCTIGLGVGEAVNVEGGFTPVFGVLDIESARSELEGKGVKFDGEIVVYPDMVKLTTFFDPDGNKLMLSQMLMPPG